MSTATKLVVIVGVMFAVPARAGGVLHDLASDVAAKLDAMRAAQQPKLAVPVVVKWKPTRLASEELGAPLVVLVAGDLRGDGREELYAVTTRDVIAFGFAEHRLK